VVDSPLVRADGASLSPDGRQIAFKGLETPNGVVVTNLDGSNRTYVVDGGPRGGIAWSPDGRHLLFTNGTDKSLFIVAIDGSDLIPWGEGHLSAAWRPGS
jgi:Tol biopolymer transport system component